MAEERGEREAALVTREQGLRALLTQVGVTAAVCVPMDVIMLVATFQVPYTFMHHLPLMCTAASLLGSCAVAVIVYVILYEFHLVDPSKDSWQMRISTMAFHLAMVSSPILMFTACFIRYNRMWMIIAMLGVGCCYGFGYSILKDKI